MKLNDLAFSINIGDAQLCHQCAEKQTGGVALGLSKALSQRGREKDTGNLLRKKKRQVALKNPPLTFFVLLTSVL